MTELKFKVWDKEKREWWPETFTALELATSRRFPSNATTFYEIVPDLDKDKDLIAVSKKAKKALRDFLMSDEMMGTGEGYSAFILKAIELRKRSENLFADSAGRTWHIMEREGGSICLYYTRENNPAHFVVWDSLDAGLNGGGE